MYEFTEDAGMKRVDRPPWMAEIFAANMAYRPKSKPNFADDRRHDVHDIMLAARGDTIPFWAGAAGRRYLQAARLLDRMDDPIADSLQAIGQFDSRPLALAHDYLAAYWRAVALDAFLARKGLFIDASDTCLPLLPKGKSVLRCSYSAILAAFRHFLSMMVDYDSEVAPKLVRQICLVMVRQNSSQGVAAAIDLLELVRTRYRLPSKTPS